MKTVPIQTDALKSKIRKVSYEGFHLEVTEEIAVETYKEYSAQFGSSQTFDRLHERGGFEIAEMIMLLYSRCRRLEGKNDVNPSEPILHVKSSVKKQKTNQQ